MEIKEDKDFLFATKQARLTTFLENDEERRMFRNAIYNAIKWGKRQQYINYKQKSNEDVTRRYRLVQG